VNRIQGETETRLFGIRQARSADCDAIRDFLAGLSPRTRYLRFFTGAPSSTAAALRLLAGGGDNTDAVLATKAGAIIGHAMAADTTGRHGARVAEIGVAVADAWQGQGVGSALTRALADRARARGASTLAMDVLAENQQVLAMIAHHWPAARYDHSGGYVTIHARLLPGRWLPSLAPSATVAAGG
jgi:L-amino acid N-acyltransferase YncA